MNAQNGGTWSSVEGAVMTSDPGVVHLASAPPAPSSVDLDLLDMEVCTPTKRTQNASAPFHSYRIFVIIGVTSTVLRIVNIIVLLFTARIIKPGLCLNLWLVCFALVRREERRRGEERRGEGIHWPAEAGGEIEEIARVLLLYAMRDKGRAPEIPVLEVGENQFTNSKTYILLVIQDYPLSNYGKIGRGFGDILEGAG